MSEKTYLRYPLSDDHKHKGIVYFQVVAGGSGDRFQDNLLGTGTGSPAGQKFGAANRPATQGSPSSYGNACILYLPAAIQVADSAVYENVSLGSIGATTEAALGSGKALGGVATAVIAEELGSVVDALSSGASVSNASDAVKLMAVRAVSKSPVAAAELSGAVKSVTRITVNPNIRAIFNQVPLREFAFTFKLIANSPEEAVEIKHIIKFFRRELYPTDITGSALGQTVSYGYKFPDQFRIEFHHPAEQLESGKWSPSQVATRIKDCYLHTFNAVYNATSMGMHKDGNFTEIDISLSFREATTLTQVDIDKGY